jgi:hypothetical protein
VRKLPEEHDREHDQSAPLQTAARGYPTEHSGHRARKGADKRAERMDAFQRRVSRQINERRRQREQSGQPVGRHCEIERAADREQHTRDRSMQQAHPPGRQRTIGGPAHARVHLILHDFIERRRPR